MHKFILMILAVAGLYLSVPMLAVDSNQAQSSVAATNAVQKPSDADLRAAAHGIWLKLVLYAVLAFLGGLVVAGFAIYGAYKSLGVKGVIGVGIVVLFLFFAIGSILCEAF
jgi:hypothetical protein